VSTAARARRDLYAASAALLRDCLRCNGFAISSKTSPTSATHIWVVRTSSRSFPGSWLVNNGSNSPPPAGTSAAPACPQIKASTSPITRCPTTAIATRVFVAKYTACNSRACPPFSCASNEKPIALHACKFCYRSPGTRRRWAQQGILDKVSALSLRTGERMHMFRSDGGTVPK
jgi:hypothetical protein